MTAPQFKTEAFMSVEQLGLLIGFCSLLVLIAFLAKNFSKRNASQLSDKTEDATLCHVTSKRLSRTLTIHSIEKNGRFATVLESEKNIIQLSFQESEQIDSKANE